MITNMRKGVLWMSLMTKLKGFLAKCGYCGDNGEYYVKLSDIKIQEDFRRTRVGYKKWKRKLDYYNEHGEFESKIVLRRSDWMLLDGYSSFKIAELKKLKKVPVYFVD